MKYEESKIDLDWINSLPGNKIISKGNHDYWWTTVTNLNKLYDNMKFLQTNFYEYGEYAICGGRGWICPNDFKFDDNDEKIYKREENRIRLSLQAAKKKGYSKFIVITHYPPTNGKESFKMGLKGVRNGVEYILASCDYTDFNLIKIMD